MRYTLLLSLLLTPFASARDFDYREDLRFAEALRAQGEPQLALEWLERLRKNASPELLKELPLELAKTRLRVASDEPETGKRLAMYKEAQEDFLKFIKANPGHPRLIEANLDVARVLNLQGKTELSRAILAEDSKSRRELSAKSRATLQQAAKQLLAAEKALQAQLEQAEGAARTRLENEIQQTQFERALNLYDQASTYLSGGNEQASALLVQAGKMLTSLADGPRNHPITWKATAWLGRVLHQTDTAEKARARFQEVINASNSPAAFEGVRLARYFRLLVIRDQPDEADRKAGVNTLLLDGCARWRSDYRRYLNTPEGVGVTFLFAQIKLAEAATNKRLDAITVNRYREEARALLREVETSENEYTEQARKLKIETMAAQGLFKAPIDSLRRFEDCYVRAQYEAIQMNREQQEIKDPKELDTKRKQRLDTILQVLQKGLALPETSKLQNNPEVNNARSMLAFWSLTTGKLQQAIEVGERFARDDPRSSQAEMAAVYALQAYSQLVAQKQAKFDESATKDRTAMIAFANYVEERWPRGLGGDLARHTVGLQFLREGNYPEAIKKLSAVSPEYTNYLLVCYQIADACSKAEKAAIAPIPGDQPGDYRNRAVKALESMPLEALGGEPFNNHLLVAGKAMLGRELFRLKRFQEMNDLASGLLDKLDQVRFSDDDEKNQAIRNQLRFELVDVKLLARYGLAETAFAAGDHAKVVELLDPIVEAARASDDSPERLNLQKRGTASLILCLRSNIQLGRIERTDAVLDLLDKVSDQKSDTIGQLRLLAFLIKGQIDDLRKKGDKNALERAIKGYTAIIDKRVAKQKETTAEFARVLADCYSNMNEHAKAAAELEKVDPPVDAKPGSKEEELYRRVQTELVRELRLTKDSDNLVRARQLMNSLLATPQGKRDLLILKEQGFLLEAEDKFTDAFGVWNDLTKRLAKEASRGGTVREHYFECYFQLVQSIVKIGLSKSAAAERDKYLRLAAQRTIEFEKSWVDFGSEASKKRFTELLAQEAGFRQEYEALKQK